MHNLNHPKEWTIAFIVIALILLVIGLVTMDWPWFVRAIIFSSAAYYIIWRNKRKKSQ